MTTLACQVGYIILAHEEPDMVAVLADHLAAQGAPVVIHADRRNSDFRSDLLEALDDCAIERVGREEPVPDTARIDVISSQSGEWGTFGLVAATLDAVRVLLDHAPGLSHISLLSGDSLPLRPHRELAAYCAEHAGVDFIESVPAEEGGWVKGGLSIERFTLWFPFAWRRQRWLFDRLVDLQRLLRVRRRMPRGLSPHFGGQWWCLTAKTLRGILAEPNLKRYRRFFRRSWIPDESFFQTLVRREGASGRIGPPLMLARFDEAGRPVIFYDDHAEILAGSDYFFARKVSPWALTLRRIFLSNGPRALSTAFEGRVDAGPFKYASHETASEHTGLQMQARMPSWTDDIHVETAAPFGVIVSPDARLLERVSDWLAETASTETVLHRRLFAPAGAEFGDGAPVTKGNLASNPTLRDYRPEQFLARLIWANRGQPLVFTLTPHDGQRIGRMILGDGNARILMICSPEEEETLRRSLSPGSGDAARVVVIAPEEFEVLMAEVPGIRVLEEAGLIDQVNNIAIGLDVQNRIGA